MEVFCPAKDVKSKSRLVSDTISRMRSEASRKTGLARALSKLGYCSRSTAFELIRSGRVQLGGRVLKNPEAPVRLGHDRIQVDGREVKAQKFVYWMLNKPRGIVTSADDEKGRETVYSLLPDGMAWIAPVGRLDKASEGLLLLTNDSEWAARILEPATKLAKTYHVQVAAKVDERLSSALQRGILVAGVVLRASSVRVVRGGSKNTWIEIVLHEGKNRQIRRMLEALGIEVLRLMRVRIGPLTLGELKKGEARELEIEEKQQLDAAMKFS